MNPILTETVFGETHQALRVSNDVVFSTNGISKQHCQTATNQDWPTAHAGGNH
jgi:hypothetical protein